MRKIRDCPSASGNFGRFMRLPLLLGNQLCIKDGQPLTQGCVLLQELKLLPAMKESILMPGLVLRLLDDPVTSHRAVDLAVVSWHRYLWPSERTTARAS